VNFSTIQAVIASIDLEMVITIVSTICVPIYLHFRKERKANTNCGCGQEEKKENS